MSADSGKTKAVDITWGPQAAIVVTVVTFLLSQLLVGLLFGLLFAVLRWEDDEVNAWSESAASQFLVIFFSSVLTLGILAWFLRKRRAGFKVLGFARNPRWRDAAYMALGFCVYFGLLIITSLVAAQILGIDTQKEQEIGFDSVKQGEGGLLWVFLSLVVLPPLVEETLFRGFLYGGLRTKLTFVWSVVITGVLFAAPHLFATTNGVLWIAAIDTFVLSLVLCYVREKTGALWACIGIHAIKNSLAFLFVFVV